MTETLIKWRRVFYTPTLHTICAPTSQVVLGINTETTKILLQKIGKHWQYRNNLWNMWQSIFKIVFWSGLFLTVLALGMIISIFSSFGDLNSNFLKIKMTYSSKNLSRYMIQKEKKKIKTEVGWNFCQLMKTLDFWALCREIPFWWLLPMCKFFVSYLQFWLCLCLCVCIFLVCLHKKLQCHSGVPRWWIIFNAALKRLKTPSHSTVTLSPQLLTRVYLCPNNLFSGICVSVSVYICSTLNCHAVPANADESVSVSLAQRDDPKQ